MDNLIPPPVKLPKEEDQREVQKEENNGGNTRDKEEDRKEDSDKTQAVESGQEAVEDDNLDYSDSNFIY